MRAIILAAGKGSRISEHIGDMPKSLLEIDGKTILERTVEMLLQKGAEVSICVGYQYHMIQEALKGKQITYYYNPFYDITNNIGSIWFAREEFTKEEDVIILSADVIFSEDILQQLCEADSDLVMATDTSRIQDGDYFFTLNEKEEIVDYGPQIPLEKRNCEYIGLSKISKETGSVFKKRLEDMIDQKQYQCYFENVFFSFIDNPDIQLKTIDVKGKLWREIDFYEDYQKALSQFR